MKQLVNKLNSQWKELLTQHYDLKKLEVIESALSERVNSGETIYPDIDDVFNAYNYTLPQQVKVVLIGQDPYHNVDQAHGLSFSVATNIKLPPSLKNIFKELNSDLGQQHEFKSGDLTSWAKQGVLLLNRVLTVQAHKAGSHRNIGWEDFTLSTIKALNENFKHIVYILWGNDAIKLKKYISEDKNLILESVHPSPLSAYRGFFGSKPFTKSNEYLASYGVKKINWNNI